MMGDEISATRKLSLTRLRAAALVAAIAGAAGSVGFMLYAGRHNKSHLLLFLFAGWVLSPFVLLFVANAFSQRWSTLLRAVLYRLTLLASAGTLAIYGYLACGNPQFRTTPLFVMVPPLSWLLMAAVLGTAALISRRHSATRR